MCGIVACAARGAALPFLLEGLKTLEYRGYDSAGVELLEDDGALRGAKRAGRVAALAQACEGIGQGAGCGIAHTRWATHGAPTDANAHPHLSDDGKVAIVHNGIIENYRALRAELEAAGHVFASETDSEVVAHLLADELAAQSGAKSGEVLVAALARVVGRLEGSWAIAAVSSEVPGRVALARKGSPLIVAQGEEGCYAASDVTALAGVASSVIQLEDGQLALLRKEGGLDVYDEQARPVERPCAFELDWDMSAATLDGYEDFMAKEIAEQPEAIGRLLSSALKGNELVLEALGIGGDGSIDDAFVRAIDHVYVIACGTSLHVGMLARRYLEGWARVPVSVEAASEFVYGDALVGPKTLGIVITQSGETADTLAAARKMRAAGARVLAVTNALGSTAARECDGVLYVQAGPEVCVASTKAYTSQMMAMMLFSLAVARLRGAFGPDDVAAHVAELRRVPALMREVLAREDQAKGASFLFATATSSLFIGRGDNVATAFEGALKLKEISYLHAEGYAAGEMKHGPIALLEPGYPVVAIVGQGLLRDKMLSNMQEVVARGASCVAVAQEGDEDAARLARAVLWLPQCPDYLVAMLAPVHLQMLARLVARERGCDVDKPRNLAKSVTVE